jgi:hypothetical protein
VCHPLSWGVRSRAQLTAAPETAAVRRSPFQINSSSSSSQHRSSAAQSLRNRPIDVANRLRSAGCKMPVVHLPLPERPHAAIHAPPRPPTGTTPRPPRPLQHIYTRYPARAVFTQPIELSSKSNHPMAHRGGEGATSAGLAHLLHGLPRVAAEFTKRGRPLRCTPAGDGTLGAISRRAPPITVLPRADPTMATHALGRCAEPAASPPAVPARVPWRTAAAEAAADTSPREQSGTDQARKAQGSGHQRRHWWWWRQRRHGRRTAAISHARGAEHERTQAPHWGPHTWCLSTAARGFFSHVRGGGTAGAAVARCRAG